MILKNFFIEEDGAGAIEYALLAGLIAVAIIATATGLGKAISDKFGEIAGKVTAAGAP